MIKSKIVDNGQIKVYGWNRKQECMRGLRFNTEKWIINYIENAKEVVCITTFLLANEKIVCAIENAVCRGVRVYLLIASENKLEKDFDSEGDFSKKCIDSHIALLDRLSGKIFIRSARINHAKFIFIDPFTDNANGLISTGNFTEEGVAGRNEELHHGLDKDEVDVLASYFKHAFWNCAEHEMFLGRFSPAEKINVPVDISSGFGTSIVTSLNGNKSLHDACMNLVKKATKSLIVSAFGFDEDNDVVKAIVQKAKNGVKVIVLCRIRPKNKDAMVTLQKAGAVVYGFQYLHAKCILVDGVEAIMMTANFEDVSFNKSFEVGCLLIRQDDINVLEKVLRDWIEKEGWLFYLDVKLKELTGFFIDLEKSNYYDKKKIVGSVSFDCGIHSPSLELIHDFVPKEEIEKYNHSLLDECLYCEIDYTWKIESPCLKNERTEVMKKRKVLVDDENLHDGTSQKKFQEITESYHPKIFYEYLEGRKRRVIAIHEDSELEEAIKLKRKMKCEAIVYEK